MSPCAKLSLPLVLISGLAFAQRSPELFPAVQVATHLSRVSGYAIYVDSRVARERIPMISTAADITAEKLEEHIKELIKSLPRGGGWAKLYLPPPPKGKVWKADEVVEMARAQARLYGIVGAVEPETIEILSVKLSPEKAKPVIEAMGLKPVYVITLGRGTFEGVWQSTYGEMRLKVMGSRVTGTYTTGDGLIEATVRGDFLQGRWFERQGSRGGPIELVLSEDGDSFNGRWSYQESPDSISGWTGTRISRK